MATNIFWNIEVNGTLYEINAGYHGEEIGFIYMEDAITEHSELNQILSAEYTDGLILKNKTLNNLRIKLIPSSIPLNPMSEGSGNPTFGRDETGAIVFCLAPEEQLQGTNYFGIDINGYGPSEGRYTLIKDSENLLYEVSTKDLVDYFINNGYNVKFFQMPM